MDAETRQMDKEDNIGEKGSVPSSTPTEEQLKIINTIKGYVRCGAVPGSGKTFCITNRMARLINLGIDPSSIVALTFTNKAAANMKKRLKQMVGDKGTCFTGTFHGYCIRILKEEIHRFSWTKKFTIASPAYQIEIIQLIADELNLSLKDHPTKEYLDYISSQKSDYGYISFMVGTDKTTLLEKIKESSDVFESVYYRYLLQERDNYLLDFHDIINYAIYILKNYEDAREKWQSKCVFLLCDEYQDVSSNQEELISILSGKYGNLTVVGDDDQCIYGWRDSKPEYIRDFDKRYPNTVTFLLLQNFRSTPEIVAVANSLIIKNQDRINKAMFTENESFEKPVYNNLTTDAKEALWIAETINNTHQAGKNYSDFAILVRASAQSRAIEEAFIKSKIPYKVLSGTKFYDSVEIKTVLAYLKVVYTLSDLDCSYTINRPKRGFGKKSIEKVKKYAEEQNISFIDALGKQISEGKIKNQSVIDYYNNITKLHNEYQKYSCKDITNMVLDFGYREYLQKIVDQEKIDNISEFLALVASMEADNMENIELGDLLEYFSLFETSDDDTDDNVVKVMTIHAAKGLEFDTVFIPGLVNGLFPDERMKTQEEMEQERNLFYVAITRAEKMLYLSSYQYKYGNTECLPSSFLSDIDIELLNCINNSVIGEGNTSTELLEKAEFEVGDFVWHEEFGKGIIVEVNQRLQKYSIRFQDSALTIPMVFRSPLKKLQ